MINSLQHSNKHVMYIVTFVDIVKRYADNQRTRDSRLHYLEMWRLGKQSLNAKAEKKTRKNMSTYIRLEILRVHGFVLTTRKNVSKLQMVHPEQIQKYAVNDTHRHMDTV